MTACAHPICSLAELDDPGSHAFTLGEGDWPLRGFIVRVGERVFAYVNRCPHAGHPLNMRPDEFLNAEKALIMCRSHGAVFERETGKCVWGPCAGQSLRVLNARVADGFVVVDVDGEMAVTIQA